MEPRIQYAKTSDGVSIAYWTLGEGEPYVAVPMFESQIAWLDPDGRRFTERLARHHRLVRYDSRGFGLSDRNVTSYSLDAHVLDLEAVVDHCGLTRFAMSATMLGVPSAIAFAVRHPERVSHLVLWRVGARTRDPRLRARMQSILALAAQDWQLFTETLMHDTLGWTSASAQQWAAHLRQATAPETMVAYCRGALEADVDNLLTSVQCPTLVLVRRGWPQESREAARVVASTIPDGRLIMLDGESISQYEGDTEAVASVLEDFLTDGRARPSTSAAAALATILFTDLASSTALTQRLGDARAQELLRAHNAVVREALAQQGGSEIKHTGDGIMASFPTASGALECAVVIQKAVVAHNAGVAGAVESPASSFEPLAIHIGLNAGEPVAEDQDLFGTAVQLARRICDQASAGEILVSNVVRELAAGKGFLFADRGAAALKGFEDPVRLYEVRWREQS